MYIGLGIVLLVLGLILSMNVIDLNLANVNEGALGAILIIGGIIAIVLSLVMTERYRRTRVVDDRVERRVVEPPVVEERRYLR